MRSVLPLAGLVQDKIKTSGYAMQCRVTTEVSLDFPMIVMGLNCVITSALITTFDLSIDTPPGDATGSGQ